MKRREALFAATAIAIVIATFWTTWRLNSDITAASAKTAIGNVLIATCCGSIEYQEAGNGPPLLMVHGSGGGHDQGMAFAGELAQRGLRVIAMSRFGYLRTSMPADSSPEAQSDAHVCLLDALGIVKAAVLGSSAGGPSTAYGRQPRVAALHARRRFARAFQTRQREGRC